MGSKASHSFSRHKSMSIAMSIVIPTVLLLLVHSTMSCEYHICSNEYAELLSSRQLLSKHESQSTDGQNHDVHNTDDGHKGDNTSSQSGHDATAPSQNGQVSKEQSEYCNLLNAYNQCMKTQSKSCRGNMNYHAIVAMVRKWLKEGNCSGSYHKSRQGVRSQISIIASIKREQEIRRKEEALQKKLEICFSDAFNYTVDPVAFANSRMAGGRFFKSIKVIDDTGNVQFGPDALLSDDPVPSMAPIPGLASVNPDLVLDITSRTARSHDAPDLRSLPPPTQGTPFEEADSEDVEESDEENENLLCSLYGDPHLRTFKNEFMTCRCLGAWPLVDHPLFAVQVTNTKDDDVRRSQISGVSKVTVLVRRFTSCGIKHDLIYEADARMSMACQTQNSMTLHFPSRSLTEVSTHPTTWFVSPVQVSMAPMTKFVSK